MASAMSRSQSLVRQHVAGHRDEPLAEVGGERLEPVGAPGRRHHGGAGRVQHPGEAVAEAARRAGDDGDPPVEAEGRGEVDGGAGAGAHARMIASRTYGGRREGADRLRPGHAGLQRPGPVRGARHRARGAPLRLAVALRARHRRLPRPHRRARRGRRAHHQDQVRVLRAGRARPQPDAPGQGAGDPRPAEPRPAAARPSASARRTPASTRRSGWSAGSGRRSSTRCSRCSAGSGPGRSSTTRATRSATRAPSCGRCPSRSRSTSGSAASRPSELRRCGRLGDGWLPSFCTPGRRARRDRRPSRATPPRPAGRSKPSTSAP